MAQLLDGLLGAFGIKGREGINVVERIEQEMRINLVLDVLQLGLPQS